MAAASLEHVNVTVSNAKDTAEMLCKLFDWKIRWSGAALNGGVSYHVGGNDSYLAVYSNGGCQKAGDNYLTPGSLNHIGVEVADLGAVEERVKALGYEPYSHDDYDPGRRFYFRDGDEIEIEVVSYQ